MIINRLKLVQVSLFLSLFFISLIGQAKVVLPSVFSDNMVFQQKNNAAIWGKATPGKTVKIITTWSQRSYFSKADKAGNWKIMVLTPSYGGPYSITISDGKKITLKNVMIGEVWICSGQSNMEMPLAGWGKIKDYEKEITEAQYPNIRLLQVERNASNIPLTDAKVAKGGWQMCDPKNVAEFSSVAYFFARELYKKKGIPIGLIHTSWGGTIAEAWTSESTLKQMPDFASTVNKIKHPVKDFTGLTFNQKLEAWNKMALKNDSGYHEGAAVWLENSFDASSWKSTSLPALWEESILPAFDGVVWFRKTINIPESWAGKELKLNLGTIDDDDIAFLNGQKVGETIGYDKIRSYTIPANLVKVGENVLAVRVFDIHGGGGIYGEKNIISLTSSTGERISLDGEWQYKVGLDLQNIAPIPVSDVNPNRPTVLFNAMINPFIQFSIRGVIWYQGESNADRAHQYRDLFPAMITDWRKKWKRDNFPFYFVQLANYMKINEQPIASSWAELRDAQLKTLLSPNTGMAVAIDLGEADDIHPKNKQEVGRRLALIALAKTYGDKIAYSGPVFQSLKVDGKTIRLSFKFTNGGLKSKDGSDLTGFAIAGADQKFHWAKASIRGSQIIVKSTEVPHPVAVRYAWADNPACNLINGEGLPASPFRTDNWKDITYGKK